MASFTPYTYFQCPCTDTSPSVHQIPTSVTSLTRENADEDDDNDRTFDPRAPRANYSLYPLEHLLYCEDCHQIRCPRCVLDEIVTWYCPNCLFEVPSSTVKTEGNRCTRSCFQCPICVAPLSISSTEAPPSGLGAEYAIQAGPYVLNCGFCNWSSAEVGIQFEKPNGIYAQLSKIKNGGRRMITPKERRRDREERKRDVSSMEPDESADMGKALLDPNEDLDAESHFSNLKAFYQSQLADSSPVNALGLTGDYGYGSPGALSRIMGLYTGGSLADKKSKSKTRNMREATDALEGLQIMDTSSDERIIEKLRTGGWNSTSCAAQRNEQPYAEVTPLISDLRPIANLLRTKRSKRCKTCRHILSKPESKVQTTRFRIRLVALNYIPSISIKPLQPLQPGQSPVLAPMKPVQFLLTFRNPLFDSVKVSIATPAKTPGRFASKVTVLCPQFEIGANTDAWEEALRDGSSGGGSGREKRRTKAEASEGQHQAEAGKVWESGRNWVSVVLEVVPASLTIDGPEFMRSAEQKEDDGPLREDEDVLEIPVFVRVEWESDVQQDEGGGVAGSKDKEIRERRELDYWCVLGIGRIDRD